MIIVGKNVFSKKDKSGYCFQLNCLVPFSDNQKSAGCDGMAVLQVFVQEDFWKRVKESDFNKECEFDYGMNSFGRPEPRGIIFAQSK